MKAVSKTSFFLDPKLDWVHDDFGSKRFEGTASLAGSSESGTMIRGAENKRLFKRSGERRKIGRLARVSFNVWERVWRFDPEGSRGPGGEWRLENRR